MILTNLTHAIAVAYSSGRAARRSDQAERDEAAFHDDLIVSAERCRKAEKA
jgi:hypothetical protein